MRCSRFADGLQAAVEAGATACIQPGGSVRDEEVIAAADEAGPVDGVSPGTGISGTEVFRVQFSVIQIRRN